MADQFLSLREARKNHEFSLSVIYELTRITPINFSMYERGLSVPNQQSRFQIEQILGKINWLDVPNIKTEPRKATTWNETEREFRTVLWMIRGLPEDEKEAFLSSAKKHLRKIK